MGWGAALLMLLVWEAWWALCAFYHDPLCLSRGLAAPGRVPGRSGPRREAGLLREGGAQGDLAKRGCHVLPKGLEYLTQRVHLSYYYGLRYPKPYLVWFLGT